MYYDSGQLRTDPDYSGQDYEVGLCLSNKAMDLRILATLDRPTYQFWAVNVDAPASRMGLRDNKVNLRPVRIR